MTALLSVRNLTVTYDGAVHAVRGVSFDVEPRASLAIVGETGSGKTTVGLCLAGLLQPPTARGSVMLDTRQVLGADDATLRSLRWRRVAIALQGAPFNPVTTVGSQIAEPLRDHLGMPAGQARERAADLAGEVALEPALLTRHPHQLSGGQRRRALLAMALALDPDLVVLDEPTAGLDAASSHELVQRINTLRRSRGFALVVISHELPAAARLADRTLVLYAGETMALGPTREVVGRPVHPYTWALVNAYPVMTTTKDLRPVRGDPPDPRDVPSGCPFHPRCTQTEDICSDAHPDLQPAHGRLVACHFGGLKTLLSAVGLRKTFHSRLGDVQALRDVALALREGGAVGIVGPSGSGKSTLARILSGHLAPDAGQVLVGDTPLDLSWRQQARPLRRLVQLVMQDPSDALSPRLTVDELVREPLDIAGSGDRDARRATVAAALRSVGLPGDGGFLRARTQQLSGGQLQRIALARALVAQPKVIVADEPTSMLDASEQARLLVVLRERQTQMGLGLVLVSHDVALVRKVTDRIVVLDAGRVVEEGPSNTVSTTPSSIAGRRLIDAAPAFAVYGDDIHESPVADEQSAGTEHVADGGVPTEG